MVRPVAASISAGLSASSRPRARTWSVSGWSGISTSANGLRNTAGLLPGRLGASLTSPRGRGPSQRRKRAAVARGLEAGAERAGRRRLAHVTREAADDLAAVARVVSIALG